MKNYTKIRCYICNDFGHLSCAKLPNMIPTEGSCYNCDQSGHVGSDCSKFPKVGRRSKSPVICYRCREKGHFARTCTLPKKLHKISQNSISFFNPSIIEL